MPAEIAALERQVIILSLNDPLPAKRTLWLKRARIVRWLFGSTERFLPLANPRLEALRRYAILSRTQGRVPTRPERERLLQAGFCARQREAVDALLAPYRSKAGLKMRFANAVRDLFRRWGSGARGAAAAICPRLRLRSYRKNEG